MTGTPTEPGDVQAEQNPDQYDYTVSKKEADYIPNWATRFDIGDTIQWTHPEADGVQKSTIIGFSTMGPLSPPVIEAPRDVLDIPDHIRTMRITETSWVPESQKAAKIELEYRQKITVTLPVDAIPPGESEAIDLIKDKDPDLLVDVLPTRWQDLVNDGEIHVHSVKEVSVE